MRQAAGRVSFRFGKMQTHTDLSDLRSQSEEFQSVHYPKEIIPLLSAGSKALRVLDIVWRKQLNTCAPVATPIAPRFTNRSMLVGMEPLILFEYKLRVAAASNKRLLSARTCHQGRFASVSDPCSLDPKYDSKHGTRASIQLKTKKNE